MNHRLGYDKVENVQRGKKSRADSDGVGICETRSDIKGSLRRRKWHTRDESSFFMN